MGPVGWLGETAGVGVLERERERERERVRERGASGGGLVGWWGGLAPLLAWQACLVFAAAKKLARGRRTTKDAGAAVPRA